MGRRLQRQGSGQQRLPALRTAGAERAQVTLATHLGRATSPCPRAAGRRRGGELAALYIIIMYMLCVVGRRESRRCEYQCFNLDCFVFARPRPCGLLVGTRASERGGSVRRRRLLFLAAVLTFYFSLEQLDIDGGTFSPVPPDIRYFSSLCFGI
jgi:hypothetical protein